MINVLHLFELLKVVQVTRQLKLQLSSYAISRSFLENRHFFFCDSCFFFSSISFLSSGARISLSSQASRSFRASPAVLCEVIAIFWNVELFARNFVNSGISFAAPTLVTIPNSFLNTILSYRFIQDYSCG